MVITWGLVIYLLTFASSQYAGESCTLLSLKTVGTCVPLSNCAYAKELIKKQQRPQHCGFSKFEPIVCCANDAASQRTPILRVGLKSEQNCEKYQNTPTGEFKYNKFVVGGTPVLSKEFPHMAAIGYGPPGKIEWQCGGSLISTQFVLTAAHCLKSGDLGAARWVRLGDLNLQATNDDADPKDFEIVERLAHPSYKAPLHYNDIALVKLNAPATINAYVRPACLHTKEQLPGGSAIASGWGKTDFLGKPSDNLMKVDLNYIDRAQCQKFFQDVGTRLPRGIDNKLQICAGGTNKDTCQGDSGGPLQTSVFGSTVRYVITGVTAFGKACGLTDSPGVYTRVSRYIPWIEGIVWPN